MTKIVNLFGSNNTQTKKQPIKFNYLLDNSTLNNPSLTDKHSWSPDQFDNVALLESFYPDNHLILAWNDDDDEKFVFVGNWNDGVVD